MERTGSRDIGRAAERVGDAVIRLARDDAAFRDALRSLCRSILHAIDDDEPRGDRRDASGDGAERPSRGHAPVDLDLVIHRCDLKARGCRWSIVRRQRKADGADHLTAILPTDEALRSEARDLRECHLWMLDAAHVHADEALLELVAGAYENVSASATVARSIDAAGSGGTTAVDQYRLLAEAQSSLLAALDAIGVAGDRDQQDFFHWIRDRTARERVFIDRYMKRTDPAPYTDPESLRTRLRSCPAPVAATPDAPRGQIVNRLRYHVAQLESDHVDGPLHHWRKIVEAIDLWMAAGGAADDPEVCALLADAPADVPPEIRVTDAARHLLRRAHPSATESRDA